MSSSLTKTTHFRRLAYAAAPLLVLLLVWPARHAYADIFSAFTDCFNTVTKLGGFTSDIDGASNQQDQSVLDEGIDGGRLRVDMGERHAQAGLHHAVQLLFSPAAAHAQMDLSVLIPY